MYKSRYNNETYICKNQRRKIREHHFALLVNAHKLDGQKCEVYVEGGWFSESPLWMKNLYK